MADIDHTDLPGEFTRYYLDCDGSSGYHEVEEAFAEVLGEMFDLFKRKQKSYGPKNISAFGVRGVVMRMHDKIQRLIRLTWGEISDPLGWDETLQDTFMDTAVYALIAVLLKEGRWPE